MISNAYVANRSKLKASPDLYARFGRVVAQGAVICDTDPRFCIEAFWRAHPEARPKEGDVAKTMADALAMVTKTTAKVLRDEAKNDRARGALDLGEIREYVCALTQACEFARTLIQLA